MTSAKEILRLSNLPAATRRSWAPDSVEQFTDAVAKLLRSESGALTYFGPDLGGVRDLKFLIVEAIRGLKGEKSADQR